MHIPDGFLSPSTSLILYTVSTPFLIKSSAVAKTKLHYRLVPLVSLFSALSFVIMMFNFPLPGGTTGHAVGAAISSIVLGPWVSILTVTIALVIQALLFGDGGILTLGANIFNMAIIMSLVGFTVYKIFRPLANGNRNRETIIAFIAGYISINCSAFLTAIELGLQPLLFRDMQGHALFFPYPLAVSIPAMMIGHLTVAGLAEGLFTSLVYSWLRNTNSGLFGPSEKTVISRYLAVVLFILLLFLPLGVLAPGTAWGEWSRTELSKLGLGYLPSGIDRWSNLWISPFAGYHLPLALPPFVTYIFSGIMGTIATAGLVWFLFILLLKIFKEPNFPGKKHVAVNRLVSKNINTLLGIIRGSFFAEEIARLPGFLQLLDPRTKIISLIILMISIVYIQNLLELIIIYCLLIFTAYVSQIPVRYYISRVWLFLPFFTGIIVLPLLFNIVTPGPAILTLIHFPAAHLNLSVTSTGLYTALLLLFRVAASVSAVFLVVLSTPWMSLLKALELFRLPKSTIMIIMMTYRYITVLLKTAEDMFIARQSRNVGTVSEKDNRNWSAAAFGTLFSKTYRLSEDIYLAMISRGYRGRIYVLSDFRFDTRDYIVFLVIVLYIIMLFALNNNL